jgi:hypothetical protein
MKLLPDHLLSFLTSLMMVVGINVFFTSSPYDS